MTLGHSPDSDDAFMFHALANHKIDTGNLRFEHVLRDIQTPNDWAWGQVFVDGVSVDLTHVPASYCATLPSCVIMVSTK
jgi:1,4-dihydroxy-6-naphthoate synthase